MNNIVATGQRIAKFIASAGCCSRREAERLIAEKKIMVNGDVVLHPSKMVTQNDKIVVNGKKLNAIPEPRLWIYYKPKSLITSHKDTLGRKTVFEHLPKNLPRVISVGRLDYNTEGLLLLTNSGALARKLELPSTQLTRKYKCRIYGMLNEKQIKQLASGITVNEVKYKSIIVEQEVDVVERNKANIWVNVSLLEGKNREIRNVFAYFGIEVSRLIRTDFGPFSLGALKADEIKEVALQDFNQFL